MRACVVAFQLPDRILHSRSNDFETNQVGNRRLRKSPAIHPVLIVTACSNRVARDLSSGIFADALSKTLRRIDGEAQIFLDGSRFRSSSGSTELAFWSKA